MTVNCRGNKAQGPFSRLATVRRLVASTLALALGLGGAFALASCGGESDAKLLPGNTAREISENLDLVAQYAAEDECIGAEDAAAEVRDQVEALEGVDAKLVNAMRDGVTRLDEVVATCEEETTESIPPSTEATTTEEEAERTPPGQEKKAEKEREKEEKKLEREEEDEEDEEGPPAEKGHEEPAPPAPPPSEGEGGGTGAPGGVSPGTPAEPGDEG